MSITHEGDLLVDSYKNYTRPQNLSMQNLNTPKAYRFLLHKNRPPSDYIRVTFSTNICVPIYGS